MAAKNKFWMLQKYSIWVGPLYTSLLIRGQSAAIRGLDRGGAEGNPRGAAGAGGNPRNPPALQIREARMKRLVNVLVGTKKLPREKMS